jgi:glycerol uptake facilitator-like aquaporin
MLTMSVGAPFVATSANGGLRPEQVAELCVNRLIQVADTAPPELAAQARAFREQMLAAVLYYVRMAVTEDRVTVATKLEQAGMADLAQQIKGL